MLSYTCWSVMINLEKYSFNSLFELIRNLLSSLLSFFRTVSLLPICIAVGRCCFATPMLWSAVNISAGFFFANNPSITCWLTCVEIPLLLTTKSHGSLLCSPRFHVSKHPVLSSFSFSSRSQIQWHFLWEH